MKNLNDKINFSEGLKNASFLRRHLAWIVDAVFIIAVFIMVIKILPENFYYKGTVANSGSWLILLSLILYRIISLLIWKRTLGMTLSGIYILNGDLEQPRIFEKISAALFFMINGTEWYEKIKLRQ